MSAIGSESGQGPMTEAMHAERVLAEMRKLNAEASKLLAETGKLDQGALKFARERWWHAVFVAAAILGAGAGAGIVILRVIGSS